MLGWLFGLLVKIVIAVLALATLVAVVIVAGVSPSPGRCPSCSSQLGVDREHFWDDPGSGDRCNVCGWRRSDER